MATRSREIVLNNRIYSKEIMSAAINAFKDFMQVIPCGKSGTHIRYKIEIHSESAGGEVIDEFLNFALGCAKNKQ